MIVVYLQIVKKLAGHVQKTAAWMTNVGNEQGEILNSVLTVSEGQGIHKMAQGIVKRFADANQPEPEAIYVDRDCPCGRDGEEDQPPVQQPPMLRAFKGWQSPVVLDSLHFMMRFAAGLTTEHHIPFPDFCSGLSDCIFEWDSGDVNRLDEALKGEYRAKHGRNPDEGQLKALRKREDMARHCRRVTRGANVTFQKIDTLLNELKVIIFSLSASVGKKFTKH